MGVFGLFHGARQWEGTKRGSSLRRGANPLSARNLLESKTGNQSVRNLLETKAGILGLARTWIV